MTTKVQIICNGPSYICHFIKRDKNGAEIDKGSIRGGSVAQAYREVYLGQDEVIEVTEKYEPEG